MKNIFKLDNLLIADLIIFASMAAISLQLHSAQQTIQQVKDIGNQTKVSEIKIEQDNRINELENKTVQLDKNQQQTTPKSTQESKQQTIQNTTNQNNDKATVQNASTIQEDNHRRILTII